MKLYHFPVSPNSRKVVATLHHLDLPSELVALDLSKGQQNTPEFLSLNPNHMIPTLVDDDFVLWESNAIMQYLCSKKPGNTLLPNTPRGQADVLRWQCWQLAHFGRACGTFIFERLVKSWQGAEPDPAEIAKAEEMFHRFATVLDKTLIGREWLVGSTVTLADFSVGAPLDLAEAAGYPLASYQEIKRWYAGIEKLEAWKRSAPAVLSATP
jgi:glutathione S-transferase